MRFSHNWVMMSNIKLSEEIWVSIYRQWIWADQLRSLFRNALPDSLLDLDLSGNFTIQPYWMLMSLWYSMLFTVLEALDESKIEVPDVQSEIDELYPILKRYRNATFHIQKGYWTQKWSDLVLDDTSADKVHKIHRQVGAFLLKSMKVEE
jgi:hypothetical protein